MVELLTVIFNPFANGLSNHINPYLRTVLEPTFALKNGFDRFTSELIIYVIDSHAYLSTSFPLIFLLEL